MQHDNNIENKLREMEAMERPDMSQVDTHWQQMAAMLQMPVVPVKKVWPKWMLNMLPAAAAVLLVGAAAWYLHTKNNVTGEQAANDHKNMIPQQTAVTLDTVKTMTPAAGTGVAVAASRSTLSIYPSLMFQDAGNGEPIQWTEEDSLLGTIKLNVKDCLTCPGKSVSTIINDTAPAGVVPQLTKLQLLFAQMEKHEQYFVIDNSRDTLLRFEEGTVLLIPQNSLGGMKGVEMSAKEFYKISEIIVNKLNTESNGQQLETGGMLYLKASYQGKDVTIAKDKPLMLFMGDTSTRLQSMQLFYGQNDVKAKESNIQKEFNPAVMDTASYTADGNINWVAQPARFMRRNTVTMVKVLNLVDMPVQTKERNGKRTGYFLIDENRQLSKEQLKKQLSEKYGYDKIKLRNAEWWETHDGIINWEGTFVSFNNFYATKMGDSLWMEKEIADRYKLKATDTKTFSKDDYYKALSYQGYRLPPDPFEKQFDKLSAETEKDLQGKYGVRLSQLGWINCDRFYTDSRRKINYNVDLRDKAANYFTMLVFDNINSMMTGYLNDTKVAFQNIPVGEPVKVISIGINQKGETVYAVTHTTTSEAGLLGLQFQATSAPELKTALSKYDK